MSFVTVGAGGVTFGVEAFGSRVDCTLGDRALGRPAPRAAADFVVAVFAPFLFSSVLPTVAAFLVGPPLSLPPVSFPRPRFGLALAWLSPPGFAPPLPPSLPPAPLLPLAPFFVCFPPPPGPPATGGASPPTAHRAMTGSASPS